MLVSKIEQAITPFVLTHCT